MRFDIHIVRPTLDRTDYEEIYFDKESNRVEEEAFKKTKLNKAYYTDADSVDYIDMPETEDSTQYFRSIRDLYRNGEIKQRDDIVREQSINYKDFRIGESNGTYTDAIFFQPRNTEINKENFIDEVVIWYNNHPGKTIYLRGYSDKETGNSQLNLQLASQRINRVVDLLTRKGVPVNKIESHAYGDQLQPFIESNRNRCVIVEIK